MNEHLVALELEEGATGQDIKRAYFKLVRQHSPEKDPEGFRRIREAYEALQKGEENGVPEITFPGSDKPMSDWMWQQILEDSKRGKYNAARDTAENALDIFPDEDRFVYMSTVLNRRCGNSGKAVKASKELVKRDPENRWYQREFAIANYDRGFYKKAHPAFIKAHELGNDDREFMNLFALSCRDNGDYEKGTEILLKLMRDVERVDRDNAMELAEYYAGLGTMAQRSKNDDFLYDEIFDHMERSLKDYGGHFSDLIYEMTIAVAMLEGAAFRDGKRHESAIRLLDRLEALSRDDTAKMVVSQTKDMMYDKDIEEDERITEEMVLLVTEGYGANPFMNAQEVRYLRLCMQLCLLENPEETLKQFEILEREYPKKFEHVKDFAKALKNSNDPEQMRIEYRRRHDRMAKNFGGSYYYERFPESEGVRADYAPKVVYTSDDFTPYVRDTPKIGRNDPCPCGSGKKYKNCCMKK